MPTTRAARGFYVEFDDGTSELVTSLDGGKSFLIEKQNNICSLQINPLKNLIP